MKASEKSGSRWDLQGAERAGRVFLCALSPVQGRLTCLKAHRRWLRNSASGRKPREKSQNCLDGGARRCYHHHNWARRSRRRRKALMVPSSTLGNIPSRHNPQGAERAGRVFLCALSPDQGRLTCLKAHGRWLRNSASGRRRSCRPFGRAGWRPRPSPPRGTTCGDRRTWPAPRNFSKPPGILDGAKAVAAARRSDQTTQKPPLDKHPDGDALRRVAEASFSALADGQGGATPRVTAPRPRCLAAPRRRRCSSALFKRPRSAASRVRPSFRLTAKAACPSPSASAGACCGGGPTGRKMPWARRLAMAGRTVQRPAPMLQEGQE